MHGSHTKSDPVDFVKCNFVDVARFTISVNYTLSITVAKPGSVKIEFWLVAKKNKELEIINCLVTDNKYGKTIFGREVDRTAFRGTAT